MHGQIWHCVCWHHLWVDSCASCRAIHATRIPYLGHTSHAHIMHHLHMHTCMLLISLCPPSPPAISKSGYLLKHASSRRTLDATHFANARACLRNNVSPYYSSIVYGGCMDFGVYGSEEKDLIVLHYCVSIETSPSHGE